MKPVFYWYTECFGIRKTNILLFNLTYISQRVISALLYSSQLDETQILHFSEIRGALDINKIV